MAHPLLWPKKSFFYPIGNTPPTQFTADLPPEEPAEILILGCGDARNVLHTIFMDSKNGFQRKLDFTCNDHEPAILTRNLLLYTMLIDDIDGTAVKEIWNIYYHFFLDEASIQRLWKQCRKILDLTSNLDAWNEHEYGRCIRFCSDYTLEEIRRHCGLYVQLESLSHGEKMALRSAFLSGMASARTKCHILCQGDPGPPIRSMGPLFLKSGNLPSSTFEQFWRTGVTTGTQAKKCIHVNPTFAHSQAGRGFNAHYGTYPPSAFHLAPALASLEGNPVPPVITNANLYNTVRVQFGNWCTAFHRRSKTSPTNFHIRLFVGDVLAVCRALRFPGSDEALQTDLYCSPWGGSQINLCAADYLGTGPNNAPILFNTIDTSNLADHLGLLNILLVTVPLLRPTSTSVLHTDTLLKLSCSPHLNSLQNVRLNIPTLSVLLGVVPARILSHVITTSVAHEPSITEENSSLSQFHDPISWRYPYQSAIEDVPMAQERHCDPTTLADALFAVYLGLFQDESLPAIGAALARKQRLEHHLRTAVSYDRRSFVDLLLHTKHVVRTDWQKVMHHLLSKVENDKTLILGSNYYQDLICSLHLRNVYSSHWLTTGIPSIEVRSKTRYASWKEVPSVVCVVLVIPRLALKPLEDMDPDEVLTPILQCETRGPGWHNIHASLRPIFGTLQRRDDGSGIDLIEDPLGWNGKSPLTVSFYLPASLLCLSPRATRVGLYIRSLPSTISLMRRLGTLEIYGTNADDEEHIYVCETRPNPVGRTMPGRALPDGKLERSHHAATRGRCPNKPVNVSNTKTTLNFASGKIQSITIRAGINDPEQKIHLSNPRTDCSKLQDWDSELILQFGPYLQYFHFPFPVDLSSMRFRIARKSSYLEVEAPVQVDPDSGAGHLHPFPIVNADVPRLLNVRYTCLDLLPALNCSSSSPMDWVKPHLMQMLSDKEGVDLGFSFARNTTSPTKNPFAELKRSLLSLFEHFVEAKGKPVVFGLTSEGKCGANIILFVTRARLDLGAHTVMLDACVLSMSKALVASSAMQSLLPMFSETGSISIAGRNVSAAEMALWKRFIPASVERCRTWSHKPSCSYRGRTIPLSLERTESPICECGRGLDLGSFAEVPEWNCFAPFVVRVAIGPIFTSNHDRVWSFTQLQSYMKKLLSRHESNLSSRIGRCNKCGGPGNPTLQNCSACKAARYCSKSCQKEDWKSHKVHCTARRSTNLKGS